MDRELLGAVNETLSMLHLLQAGLTEPRDDMVTAARARLGAAFAPYLEVYTKEARR